MKTGPAVLAIVLLLAGCLGGVSPWDPYEVPHPEALLRAAPYSSLLVRVEYVEGAEPTQSAIDHVVGVLRQVTDKETIEVDGPRKVDARGWSPGGYAQDGKALLSIQYRTGTIDRGNGSSVAGMYVGAVGTIWMLPDSWRGFGGLTALLSGATAEILEAEVLAHEVGHALGLVDNGIPMVQPRIDPDDPCLCHSSNTASLMYYRVHDLEEHMLHLVGARQVGPVGFDDDDLADLQAYRQGRTGPPLR